MAQILRRNCKNTSARRRKYFGTMVRTAKRLSFKYINRLVASHKKWLATNVGYLQHPDTSTNSECTIFIPLPQQLPLLLRSSFQGRKEGRGLPD